MIDFEREEVFLLSMGPRKVQKSPSGLRDLIRRGRVSITGKVIKLESFLTEGGIATSVEALTRFRHRLNDGACNEEADLPTV